MILKRPYAFFIKLFKPIHLFLSVLVGYLFYFTNNILKFLNEYIYSSETLISKEQLISLTNKTLYVIPFIIIFLFFLLIGVMYKKNKPILFYFVGVFSFVAVLVINIYAVNFLKIISENVVSVKAVKLIYDLVFINIILESFWFIMLLIRGIGIDFKKFNFNSDISKFEINESDKEEFEVNINIDFNEKKRIRRERIRKLKYIYIENKFLINIIIFIILAFTILFSVFSIIKYNKVNKEGIYYNVSSFQFKVNNTNILNTNYQGKKITENYLIIVYANMKSNYFNDFLYLNDFSLNIDNTKFKPTKKYMDDLIDLGVFYSEQPLSEEYEDYIFVFEIPTKYVNSNMYFSYNKEGNSIDVLLNPKDLVSTELSETKKITENVVFDGALNGVEFKINNYDINKKFLLDYKYCITNDDCILSKEYLTPSINENYDKVVLKLNVEYISNSDLDVDTFYKLLSKFGIISYKINDTWYNTYKFEEIKSSKVSSKNNIYIGVNSSVINADSIKFVFNVRGLNYEYILK